MEIRMFGQRFNVGAIQSLYLILPATAQIAQVAPASVVAHSPVEIRTNDAARIFVAGARPDEGKLGSHAPRKIDHSAGVDEVLKMLQAGVSKDVIRMYIENSPIVYVLSPGDIIALKENAVPDDITTAMLKRGALLMKQISQLKQHNGIAPPFYSANRKPLVDPESYEYFQYYYLLPRTLAATKQRLFYPTGSPGDVFPSHYGGFPVCPFPPPAGGLP
jgi:hypothetical protein